MLLIKYITGDIHAPFGSRTVHKGGSRTQTTTSGIDPEFKPYLKEVLSDVTSKYKADVAGGPDAIVAKMTPEQQQALQEQASQAQAMMTGTGAYDTRAAEERSLRGLQGQAQRMASGAGALGSARSQAAMQGALAQRAGEYQKERQQAAQAGSELLGQVGTSKQAYEQARMDAPHTAASRYFGYLQNAPQQQVTQGGGGGK